MKNIVEPQIIWLLMILAILFLYLTLQKRKKVFFLLYSVLFMLAFLLAVYVHMEEFSCTFKELGIEIDLDLAVKVYFPLFVGVLGMIIFSLGCAFFQSNSIIMKYSWIVVFLLVAICYKVFWESTYTLEGYQSFSLSTEVGLVVTSISFLKNFYKVSIGCFIFNSICFFVDYEDKLNTNLPR